MHPVPVQRSRTRSFDDELSLSLNLCAKYRVMDSVSGLMATLSVHGW